jgi:phosphoribosylamine-glycine ligase
VNGHILVIGSGYRHFREYALRGLAQQHRVVLIGTEPLDWQLRHVVEHRVVRDLHDEAEVLAAARDLAAHRRLVGVVTWDEMLIVLAARTGAELGVPTMPVAAARACRDKGIQRERYQRTGVPSARYALAGTVADALAAATRIGYPVVVKPRAQAASIAVQIVRDDDELRTAFEFARSSENTSVDDGAVLVEEFLRGEEISVDCWVLDGRVEPYVVAVKRTGYRPFFEEVGHVVGPVLDTPTLAAVTDVVTRANNALGIDRTVTHTELMLTEDGPKVVEVNGRLGGELIPYLAQIASPGLSVGEILGAVATGREPAAVPARSRLVGIRFLYPDRDLVLRDLDVPDGLAARSWVHEIRRVSDLGTELRLPPRQFLGRAGYGIATGASIEEIDARLAVLAEEIDVVGESLGEYPVAS